MKRQNEGVVFGTLIFASSEITLYFNDTKMCSACIALRWKGIVALRPAAGIESREAGFYFTLLGDFRHEKVIIPDQSLFGKGADKE